jgi:hypothetical protein
LKQPYQPICETESRIKMYTLIRAKHFISRTLRVAAVLAAVASMPPHNGTTSAQAQQPIPKSAAEQQKKAQEGAAHAQALEQLAHQIEALKKELQITQVGIASTNPQFAQIQQQLEALLDVQKRLQQLSQRGELNQEALSDLARATNDIMRQGSEQATDSAQLQQLKDALAQQNRQLAEREKQLATILAEQRRPSLPPLENGTIKVFRLMYAQARDASKTVESLFGSQRLRVAVDERSNSLLVYGTPDVLTALDALLPRLDEQASPKGPEKSMQGSASPRSLLVRVFWLADNLPETTGQNPADFLPKSVLAATHKLGLEAPRLVTQTVNSLATGKDDSVDFSTSVPAVLLEQPVGMGCEGKLKLVSDDRVRVDMGVHVGGPSVNCELRGSMATPLGHYMVLGTANSMIAEGGPMAGGMPGAPGMGMGSGAIGPGGGFRQPAGEFGRGAGPGPAAGAAPGGVGPEGGAAGPGGGPEVAPRPAKQKFETSRFAFVVQVIEGQSYEAEKTKSDRE